VETLLASLAQALYPNPKEEQYDNWEEIAVGYTFARGGTEVVKQFLEIMRQQADIHKRLLDKKEGKDVQSHRIGE
jgi:hypothetical protein